MADLRLASDPVSASVRPPSRWQTALAQPLTRIGVMLVAIHLFLALFAPLVAPYGVSAILTNGLTPPSPDHWLGTDQIGRDYLSRLISGGRVALLVSALGVTVAVLTGTALGLAAGYCGGWVDDVVMRLTDTLMAVPELVLIAILVLTFGKDLWALSIIVAIVYTPGMVRVVRARTLSLAALDYVRAAELRGETTVSILLREIAPNLTGLLAVEVAVRVSSAVLKISALSFLGLGITQPTPDWGLMVQEAMAVVFTDPWFLILPSIALSSLIIGINFTVDGFARAYDLSPLDL
ncbi:ABC transporter permease [Pseudooceanicola algae]|uniref:Glutathione transport system permease protein GsiD n=1 Tax=Pseudooceanicola algae TaxID=1537215 RepID=A0A418SEM4_9RHOB|nr:ABC transporter permease [Pseudooceanicola algae]QPM89813.1 Glutathione transport system permease protein GsiD [Pseudooceanicola algae]